MAGKGGAAGFTLIELSIVLVIIGLIVGGILVGQDLIKAAETRAQVSQIEKYNSAVNTFRGKFGGIPGDLSLSLTRQYGFTVGAGYCTGDVAGTRDGNGLLEGYPKPWVLTQQGEVQLFWQDLSSAVAGGLIEGKFPLPGAAAIHCNDVSIPLNLTPGTTYVGEYYPQGKIGHGTFVYTYEDGRYNW